MPVLKTEGLKVGYNGVPLIENINLNLEKGQIITLIGPNGAGKSTILKTLARQLERLGGSVFVENTDLGKYDGRELAKRLSIVTTERINPEMMSCIEVVETGRYPYTGRFGILSAEDRKKAFDALKTVNGEELAEKSFLETSDGQRQRVMLARALCQEPKIIILDEPTSFLDIKYKLELLGILKRLVREENISVIMSLHELDLAQRISDFVLCIKGNEPDKFGRPEEIFTSEYISRLYNVDCGTFNSESGSVEFEKVKGRPKVFVIGGGGFGIPVYRRLNREGIPFAAGVIHENDTDFKVAASLGIVVSTEPFEPISDEAFKKAEEIMLECDEVICAVKKFGTMNEKNKRLAEIANENGLLKQAE